MTAPPQEATATIRVDKWLWYARFFKSRNLASKLVQSRKLRVNSVVVSKASVTVKVEDVLTFPQSKNIRVVRIRNIGTRRGPAIEAQQLYEDLAPVDTQKRENSNKHTVAIREAGSGRPTKADRRAIDKLRPAPDEQ